MSNICIGLKKTCLGVLDRGERGNDNETGLKEEGVMKFQLQCFPYTRCTLLSFA